MDRTIKTHLNNLAAQHNIKILHACETGSRAWGFASTDSDYDVRVIYVHPHDWYLSLNEQKDSLDLMLDNDLVDISGWDLRKALRLLAKSNAPLLERIQSPIVYQQNDKFISDMAVLARSCYSRISVIHHYHGMAKKAYADLSEAQQSGGKYKLKRLFYALRAVCVCRWILANEAMPPIEFAPAYTKTDLPASLVARIEALIALKATVDEGYWHSGDSELLDFIREMITEVEDKRLMLPSQRVNWSQLDDFFRQTVIQNSE